MTLNHHQEVPSVLLVDGFWHTVGADRLAHFAAQLLQPRAPLFPKRAHESGETLRRDQLQLRVGVHAAALRGVFFIHDAWDLCFEVQCRLLRTDAFGVSCSRLQAHLGKAVPARARLQIAEQIWVEV